MMEPWQLALLLATAIERFVEYIFRPFKQHWPARDFWWIPYVVFILGFAAGWCAGLDIYAQWLPDAHPLLRQILNAATIGCGSEFVHLIFGSLRAIKEGKV